MDRVSAIVERPSADVPHRHIARHGLFNGGLIVVRDGSHLEIEPRTSGPPDRE
jgi:hypothetical protein